MLRGVIKHLMRETERARANIGTRVMLAIDICKIIVISVNLDG